MSRGNRPLTATACLATVFAGCMAIASVAAEPVERPADWTDATHSKAAAPDYERLFAMDEVHELHIRIAPEDFARMQADLASLGPSPRRVEPPPSRDIPGAANGSGRRVVFGTGPPDLTGRDPIYVPVTVFHDGRTWTAVGMRYKGNSSLMSARTGRSSKVPFRLDFDRYEDEQPETEDQRFYGFEKLTFSSNFSDDSMLREVLATEAFRDFGVAAARAAFYRIFVDTGGGEEYWGLYTMIEDPADGAMLDAQFGSHDGNLYKPEGHAASWTSYDELSGFNKKTNEKAADYSDVEAALVALHARRDNPAAWRSALEASFDVETFLRWLAMNTAIDNWDSYGRMAHNYYLYGDPAGGGRLRWIPWDHNMAFGMSMGGRRPAIGSGFRSPVGAAGDDFLHEYVSDAWPLIKRILADEIYAARYHELLSEAVTGYLSPGRFEARAETLHAMIAPFVVGELGERPQHTTLSSPGAFDAALPELIEQVRQRVNRIRARLGQ